MFGLFGKTLVGSAAVGGAYYTYRSWNVSNREQCEKMECDFLRKLPSLSSMPSLPSMPSMPIIFISNRKTDVGHDIECSEKSEKSE